MKKRTLGYAAAATFGVSLLSAVPAMAQFAATATTDLNIQIREGFANFVDHIGIDRVTGKGTVQIYHMQALRPCFHPFGGDSYRVI